jgi:hypothetical protein
MTPFRSTDFDHPVPSRLTVERLVDVIKSVVRCTQIALLITLPSLQV